MQNGWLSSLFGTAFKLLIPLVLAKDIASASSTCDELVNSLNAKRTRTDFTMEHHVSVEALESMLDHLNYKQGLGFVINLFGSTIVVDRKTYRNIFGAVVSLVSTVGPYLLLMSTQGLVGEHPAHVKYDVYQLPSGQFCSVSPTAMNYTSATAYCIDRGMVGCSVHSRADADALEHLLVGPTFLGATLTGMTGEWAWDDGSPFDFEHSSESFDRAFKSLGDDPSLACPPRCDADPALDRCYYGGDCDGGGLPAHKVHGVVHLAQVPDSYRHVTESGATFPYDEWVSWRGEGPPWDVELPIACCAPKPSVMEFCESVRRTDKGVAWAMRNNVCH